jgi:Flp pilus assembly protein RcpC/CpaB
MSISSASSRKKFFDGRKVWLFFAVGAALLAAIPTFFLLQTVSSTTTFYVLNSDVPARTLITEDLLSPVTTSDGGQPRTALSLGDVLSSEVYTKYSLDAGDILTSSNAGALAPLSEGLPEDFVVASFKASPSVAAGGKLQRGDYVDLFVVSDQVEGATGFTSHLFLQRVLILDATIDLDSNSSASADGTTTSGEGTSAADNSAYRSGVPVLFTVGISQADAARLAVASNYDMYVVLSSANSSANGAVESDTGAGSTDIFSGSTGDAGFGTDATFGQGGAVATDTTSTTDTSTEATTAPETPATTETTEPVPAETTSP